ncbi:DUF418 domain-containing protein [Nesterenkonia sandarakina]|uniref:Putative membrane protein YeiB n=1 Tax=Nesterenkonia sandarakina TaxID=272918 RepID=A0A2T0YJ18_9MICC|nr:DUF418 domain-containing protein [Nesterenkonia sandarakina]PRZ15113.1 putative membrane protein YeiB [Nesterenkonia sandarakina]
MLSSQARGLSRLYALDVARAAAVFGMIIVNVGPYNDDGWASWIVRALNGRASILFVVLAGIGVTFLARRSLTKGITRRSTLLWRGLLLLGLGLGLQTLEHGVNVILSTYAALFFLAAFMVKMSTRWLFWSATASALLGPVLWILARQRTDFHIEPAQIGDSPFEILGAILISGPYPLVVWIAPFFLGVWLGRQPLGNAKVQRRLVYVGAIAGFGAFGASEVLVRVLGEPDTTEVGFDRMISAVGHSQMPLWLISASGTAVMVLGILLIVVPYFNQRIRLLVAVGQMPLTAYTAHLVVIALFIYPGPQEPLQGFLISCAIMLGLILFAVVWMANFRYGPLEALLRKTPAFLRVSYRVPERHRRRKLARPYPRRAKPGSSMEQKPTPS